MTKLYNEILEDLLDMSDNIILAKDINDYAKIILPTHKLVKYIERKIGEQTITPKIILEIFELYMDGKISEMDSKLLNSDKERIMLELEKCKMQINKFLDTKKTMTTPYSKNVEELIYMSNGLTLGEDVNKNIDKLFIFYNKNNEVLFKIKGDGTVWWMKKGKLIQAKTDKELGLAMLNFIKNI